MSYSVSEQITVRDLKQRIYVDITTNQINTATGVTGENNNFFVDVNTIKLDPNKSWTAEVIQFSYLNIASPSGTDAIKPIVLCDFTENIFVNNTNSSIIYKGNIRTGSVDYIENDTSNNYNLVLPVSKNTINGMNFQIVRSDNGEPFPFASKDDVVTLTVLFTGE